MSDEDKKEKKDDKSKKERKGTDDELGEVSYTYWKRDSDIKADHKGFQPQKVTDPNINNNQPQTKNKVASAWNQAGTWEEKKISKEKIESFFNEYISKNKKEYKNAFTFEDFSNYSGDVRIFL